MVFILILLSETRVPTVHMNINPNRHEEVSKVLLALKRMKRPLSNAGCSVKHSGEIATIGSIFQDQD